MRRAHLAPLLVLTACTIGEAPPREVSADGDLPADLAQGDVIVRGGIALEVPAPGETVTAVLDHDDGTVEELTIAHLPDGKIAVAEIPEEPLVLGAGTSAACADSAYTLSGHRWTQPLAWRFQASSTPAGASAATFETALQHAASAITSSRNDCGLADQVGATHRYLGRTSTPPNIRADATTVTCGARDGTNAVAFGVLPSNYLGVACTWSTDGVAVESDLRFNRARRWFAGDVPAGCTNRQSLLSTATHEFGHAFGLGHVSASRHGSQTMSTTGAPCSNAKYTLGRGDVSGLRALY